MGKFIDLKGKKFGRWIVLGHVGIRGGKRAWKCACKCGTVRVVLGESLRGGRSKSCGCLVRETTKKHHTKHGMSHTLIYKIWSSILQRCTNPNANEYRNYGGRGIGVSDRWRDFENFYVDMGDRPDGLQIDRINNDLGYSRSNCRWVSPKQNSRNQRSNRIITWRGESRCLIEWSELTSISAMAIYHRINRGWSVERALTQPVRKRV